MTTTEVTTTSSSAPARAAEFSAGVFEAIILGGDWAGRTAWQGAVWAARRVDLPARGAWRLWRDLWDWAKFKRALDAEIEGLAKPSERVKAATALEIQLKGPILIRRVLATMAVAAVVVVLWNVLGLVGPLWPVPVLAVVFGLGWYATRPRRHATAAVAAVEAADPGADKLRTALVGSVPAIRERLREHPDALKVGKERTDGNGYARKVTLPIGVSASRVASYVEDIAGGLDVAANRVIIEAKRDGSPREAVVWVAGDTLDKLPAPQWALRHASRFDMRKPIPLGETLKGEPVSITLAGPGGSILAAGKSGSGKTTTLRAILAAAVLDPRATIALCDLKDAGDFDSLAPALDWYAHGNTAATLDRLETMLGQAVAILDDGKTMRMDNPPLTVIAIDEAHNMFAEKSDSKRFAPLVKRLVKEGRAAGIVLIMATQKPTSDGIPTAIRDMMGARICQRVEEATIAQAALGTAANKPGRKFDELGDGQAYMSDEKLPYDGMVRVAYVTKDAAGEVAQAHPRVPGQRFPVEGFPTYPADVETDVQDPEPCAPIITDLLSVWPAGQDRASTGAMLSMLGESAGRDGYADWTPEDVTRALKAAGWTPRGAGTVWIDGKSRRGAYRADLEALGGCVV